MREGLTMLYKDADSAEKDMSKIEPVVQPERLESMKRLIRTAKALGIKE
jgi:hypothetical protein